MPADPILRYATTDDLPAIAAIHRQAYSKKHFTSRLSTETLAHYYGLFLSDGSEVMLLVERSGIQNDRKETIAGFAVFGTNIGKKLAKFKSAYAADIIRASAAHPIAAGSKIARRAWNHIALGKPITSADYLLLSVAVASPGKGVGGILLDTFLNRASESGAKTVGLYVNAENIGAINAYVSKGFRFRQLYGGQYYMERHLEAA